MASNEFNVTSAPNPFQAGINAAQKGFELGVKGAERQKDRDLTASEGQKNRQQRNDLAGASQDSSRAKKDYQNKNTLAGYVYADSVYEDTIATNMWQRNRAGNVIEKRIAVKGMQFNSIEQGALRNQAAIENKQTPSPIPLVRGAIASERGGPIPIFTRMTSKARDNFQGIEGVTVDDTTGIVSVDSLEALNRFTAKYGNPIDNPKSKHFEPVSGEELEPDDYDFLTKGELEARFSGSQSKINDLEKERSNFRRKTVSTLAQNGYSTNVRDLGLYGDMFKKKPKLKDFMQLSSETNFSGLSLNQKQAIFEDIQKRGGIDGALQYVMQFSGPEQDKSKHMKWLQRFMLSYDLVDESTYAYSQIDKSYFTDPQKAQLEIAFNRLVKDRDFGPQAKSKGRPAGRQPTPYQERSTGGALTKLQTKRAEAKRETEDEQRRIERLDKRIKENQGQINRSYIAGEYDREKELQQQENLRTAGGIQRFNFGERSKRDLSNEELMNTILNFGAR